MRIEDGKGTGAQAHVDHNHRLSVDASVRSAQSRVSIEDGKSFQVSTVPVNVGTSDQTILLLKNNSKDEKMVVTYIRIMSAGVADWNAGGYFTINLGGNYASGGAAVVPTNVNTSSGKEPLDMAFYSGSTPIVTSGTSVEIDRHYCANSMCSYNKEGSVVIAPGGMLAVNHIGSTVAGVAYARVSFYLTLNGGG